MISHAAGRPISRTAFLHVDYRKITPIDTPLAIRGRVTSTEGRKAFVSAELVDSDRDMLAEGNGLMVRLLARPALSAGSSVRIRTMTDGLTEGRHAATEPPKLPAPGPG